MNAWAFHLWSCTAPRLEPNDALGRHNNLKSFLVHFSNFSLFARNILSKLPPCSNQESKNSLFPRAFLRHCIFAIWKCNAVLSLKTSMFSNLGFHLSYNTSNWRVALAHFLKQSSPVYKRLSVIHHAEAPHQQEHSFHRCEGSGWPLEPPQTKHQFWNGTVFSRWCPWRDSAVLSPSMITRPTRSKLF